ncbi:paraneoplastic antigen Ma1 homolog [Corythoichthys intestinalis]|uniref:paraneoplastic antigen Ma1 homolog n=1 Tax=Corythoichthys intestinalis TaxID=161448 RepID=UPI0025A59478|nr:paraneoplastic antigen Ma1 homolog [Corythoichthys intestinalis]XP_057708136.1 paraneoplastic antigen Ma1 homolog [Corythoichthys intestinalis]
MTVIEETVQTIKALGRVWVRGKMFDTQTQTLTVLCECREEVDSSKVPPELISPTSGGRWTVVVKHPQQDDFSEKLAKFLEVEGKTLEDITTESTSGSDWNPESIIRAVGDVLRQSPKPTESHNYHRLRTFSGISPTPAGEESLDSWLDQARFMAEEYECSEREKKRRIVESLKGPAMEIIQAVRGSNHNASCMEYIQAIDDTFGSTESGEDLYLSFKSLYQKPNERLSDFLRRLEKSLSKVIQRGGLPHVAANRARLDQLIKGAVESDLMRYVKQKIWKLPDVVSESLRLVNMYMQCK